MSGLEAVKLEGTPVHDYDPVEWKLRQDLTDFYHLADHLGWSEIVFNHISARLPGDGSHRYLVNPFGLTYDEITPHNLLTVDVDGNMIGASEYRANPAGFALHGVIHANRPDVGCVAHAHTLEMSAVVNKRNGLAHDNFYGAQLTGRVGYHDFEGITLYAEEKTRMLASLGDKDVLALRNHGIAVCGPDIPTTFLLLWIVQRAAHVQMLSQSMAGEDIVLDEQIRTKSAADGIKIAGNPAAAAMVFGAAVRKMKRERQGSADKSTL
jgi:ribulose-5-phosphate 4-epimerase/fuculose-1-phosphate aldolase